MAGSPKAENSHELSDLTLKGESPDQVLALEYDDDENLSPKELELREKERRINADLDARIAKNPNALPRAIYYILPNEFGERFCYYGLSAFLVRYLQFIGAKAEQAKAMTHAWKMVTYFCPLIGAALSDSFLGKYRTIVWLSAVYFIGNVMMVLTAIPSLRSIPSVSVGMYLIALGTGGIKPCVGPHGGDQFLKVQADALRRFFSLFYISINAGSVLSAVTPIIKDNVSCFGDYLEGDSGEKQYMCYFAGFMGPAIMFAIAYAIFVYGDRYYRVVPPTGDFIPAKMVRVIFGYRGYGEQFTADTFEFLRVLAVTSPIICSWMIYDQGSTEWQNQYSLLNGPLSPEVWVTLVNPVMVCVILFCLANYIYPALERMGLRVTPLRRMCLGTVLVTVSFVISAILQYKAYDNYDGDYDKESGLPIYGSCRGKCVSGYWQLPQWFLLSLGECMFSPTGNEFTYTQVSKSMKAISSSFWLLMVSIGNFIVVAVEESIGDKEWASGANLPNKLYLYVAISAVGNILMIAMSWRYKYKPGTDISAKG